jgi:Ser/Thr protein kinase RdoA (MazF antagonist)
MEPERTAEAFVESWLGPGFVLSPLTGGMNSSVWAVQGREGRFALKIHDESMLPGLEVARELAQRGFRSGAPIRIHRDGPLVVALLEWVSGEPLAWEEARLIGVTLRSVHESLACVPPPDGIRRWPWSWLNLSVIDETAVAMLARETVERAEVAAAHLPHGLLHGDPAPEAFINNGGNVGLIDWGSAFHGPLLYDVASAVMYSDRSVATAYGGIDDSDLDTFLAFRAVVQTWYFADRIARGNLTGSSAEENRAGYASGVRLLRRVLQTETEQRA